MNEANEMDMDERVAGLLMRYMVAAVSMRVGRPVTSWPEELVADCFDLLGPRRVSFDSWCALKGEDLREAREQLANRRGLRVLESLHPGAARREDPPTPEERNAISRSD